MEDSRDAGITAESVEALCDELNALDVFAERRLHAVAEAFDRVRALIELPEGKELALAELQRLEQSLTQKDG